MFYFWTLDEFSRNFEVKHVGEDILTPPIGAFCGYGQSFKVMEPNWGILECEVGILEISAMI